MLWKKVKNARMGVKGVEASAIFQRVIKILLSKDFKYLQKLIQELSRERTFQKKEQPTQSPKIGEYCLKDSKNASVA